MSTKTKQLKPFTNSILDIIKDIKDNVVANNNGNNHDGVSASTSTAASLNSLTNWNDEIEQIFVSSDRISLAIHNNINVNNHGDDGDDGIRTDAIIVSSVKEVADELHRLINRIIISHLIKKDGDNIDNNNANDNANNNANDLSLILANKIATSFNNYYINSITFKQTKRRIGLQILSQLIRACKNMIRWNRILLSQNKFIRRSSNSNSKSCQISGIDSCSQLCSNAMIKLYLVLLETSTQSSLPLSSESLSSSSSSSSSQADESHNNNDDKHSNSIPYDDYDHDCTMVKDDLAKNACVAIFHSTYSEAVEPICKKSLREFISPKSQIYGIPTLARLLVGSSVSTPVMLVLIKIVHNLVGSTSGVMTIIDKELKSKSDNIDKEQNHNPTHQQEEEDEEKIEMNLISVLISTLAWSIRSTNPRPFPGNDVNHDKRPEIAIEIIRVLFALQNKHNSAYKKVVHESNPDIMTQLGIIIVDILHIPNNLNGNKGTTNGTTNGSNRVYDCKMAVLMLLMDAPKEFTHFLYINHCIGPLLTLLWIQLNETVIENEGMVQGQQSAVSILPILIVLTKLSKSKDAIKRMIKEEIFPNDIEDDDDNDTRKANNMNPIDAPPGTTRWKLLKLMTWVESNVKRCSSELVWTLCEGDSKEFVKRTGFGNAVHMLGLKGLVNIPK